MQSWRNYGFWRDPEEKAAARARLRRVGGRAKSEAIEVCSSSVSEEEPLACITGIQDEVAALKPKKRTIPTPDRKAEPLVCSTGIQDVVAVLKPKSKKMPKPKRKAMPKPKPQAQTLQFALTNKTRRRRRRRRRQASGGAASIGVEVEGVVPSSGAAPAGVEVEGVDPAQGRWHSSR